MDTLGLRTERTSSRERWRRKAQGLSSSAAGSSITTAVCISPTVRAPALCQDHAAGAPEERAARAGGVRGRKEREEAKGGGKGRRERGGRSGRRESEGGAEEGRRSGREEREGGRGRGER
eukprot:1721639-Rhodomonas_salina.1